jgi:hypothetical protein
MFLPSYSSSSSSSSELCIKSVTLIHVLSWELIFSLKWIPSQYSLCYPFFLGTPISLDYVLISQYFLHYTTSFLFICSSSSMRIPYATRSFLGTTYEGVSKSFWTGWLEQELQMIQLSATRYSYTTTLQVSLESLATITLHVASQQVFIVAYFVIDSVQKLLGTPLYIPSYLF